MVGSYDTARFRKKIYLEKTHLVAQMCKIGFQKLQTKIRLDVKGGFNMEVSSHPSLRIDEIIWSGCLWESRAALGHRNTNPTSTKK